MQLNELKDEINNIKNRISSIRDYSILINDLYPKTDVYLKFLINNGEKDPKEYKFIFDIWINIQKKMKNEKLYNLTKVFWENFFEESNSELKYKVNDKVIQEFHIFMRDLYSFYGKN